jgi:hypothetical protein
MALIQYAEPLSSSLNPIRLRACVQIETPLNASVSRHYALTGRRTAKLCRIVRVRLYRGSRGGWHPITAA